MIYFQPPRRGQWIRNRIACESSASHGTTQYHHAIVLDTSKISKEERRATAIRRSKLAISEEEPQSDSTRSPLLELPDELLLNIARYVVPTRHTFHVCATADDNDRPLTVIHQFCRESVQAPRQWKKEYSARQHLTAMASACRHLSGIYYSVMYGENQYIFDVASSPSVRSIPGPSYRPGVAAPLCESWACCYDKRFKSLWPLQQRSMKYVRDLMIVVTPRSHDFKLDSLRSRLKRIIRFINSCKRLSKISIDIGPTSADWNPRKERFRWQVEDSDNCLLRLCDKGVCAPDCKTCDKMKPLWHLLRKIHAERHITLSGHIDPEVEAQMTAGRRHRPEAFKSLRKRMRQRFLPQS